MIDICFYRLIKNSHPFSLNPLQDRRECASPLPGDQSRMDIGLVLPFFFLFPVSYPPFFPLSLYSLTSLHLNVLITLIAYITVFAM